jgi:long-subunit acyl-CoA synthetase (AMP-forming)
VTPRTHAVNETPVPTSTLVELFFEAVERHRGSVALQAMVDERSLRDYRYEDVLAVVKQVVAAFEGRGLVRGDRVAILSENRPEWAMVDYACLCGRPTRSRICSSIRDPDSSSYRPSSRW